MRCTRRGRASVPFSPADRRRCGDCRVRVGHGQLLVGHDDSAPIYVASALLGVGIGLAFAAMANLIVQAVDVDETGVATGMNTVARTVGGAVGGQLAATFVAGRSVEVAEAPVSTRPSRRGRRGADAAIAPRVLGRC